MYQNPKNERHVYKNNYPLTHVFQLLVGQLFFADISHTYWILIPLTWYHLIPNTFSHFGLSMDYGSILNLLNLARKNKDAQFSIQDILGVQKIWLLVLISLTANSAAQTLSLLDPQAFCTSGDIKCPRAIIKRKYHKLKSSLKKKI